MRRGKRSFGSPEVRRCWERWARLVELFALRRPERRRVKGKDYALVHRELLAACRQARTGAEPELQEFYNRLEVLAEPWLTTRTLDQADAEILLDLLARCRAVERQLGSRRRWAAHHRLNPTLLFVFLGCFLLAIVLATHSMMQPALLWADDLLDRTLFFIRRASDLQKLFVVAVTLIIVSVIAVSRPARS
jgi:hypothetical protein